MLKSVLIVWVVGLGLILPALAADREDDMGRIHKATKVFEEVMRAPDQGIPHDLLERTKCVAIIPGEEKAAFIFGGNYGNGLAICQWLERSDVPGREGLSVSRAHSPHRLARSLKPVAG